MIKHQYNKECKRCKKRVNKDKSIKENNYYFCSASKDQSQSCLTMFYKYNLNNSCNYNYEQLDHILSLSNHTALAEIHSELNKLKKYNDDILGDVFGD
jgi:hypothetical protein